MTDLSLAEKGLTVRAPCAECVYLAEFSPRREHYVRCSYYDHNPLPVIPSLFRPMEKESLSQGATTRKHVEGPFRPDALQQRCPFLRAKGEQNGCPDVPV